MRTLSAGSLLLFACGGTEVITIGAPSGSESAAGGETEASGGKRKPTGGSSGQGTQDDEDPTGIVADLRADTNRDGTIRFDDADDDTGEDVWDAAHGAVFLPNIDDDQQRCEATGDDVDLPKCNDADDEIVNGADDALDLARLKTRPWPNAPAGALATLTWTATSRVRLFKVNGASFNVINSGYELSADEIENGIELAIEGKDIVRDRAEWDGYADFTYKVDANGTSKSDVVKMRVSPLMTYHHLSPAETTYVSIMNAGGNADMRADLVAATSAAGVPPPMTISTSDQWTQDFFETGFVSMPGPNGTQHAIRVNIRSANESSPNSTTNPLRRAGRVVFNMRGKDTAAIQQFDPTRRGRFDTLNSFGNFETIPPYSHQGKSYPMGRVIRGNIPSYYPDKSFLTMMESQAVQPAVYVDTSWLLVGHIDETVSFIKASSGRGWVMLANDAAKARNMLEAQSSAGRGSLPMFVGKSWGQTQAQVTIDQVLADTDVMAASAEAAVEVDAQLAIIKAETGLTDAEILHIPYLHQSSGGRSVAYQPGMANGLYIADGHFVAPDPHGPDVGGTDIFKAAMAEALAPHNVTVHWAEDWDTYHRNLGEVHCGTNATRKIPSAKWWESGR